MAAVKGGPEALVSAMLHVYGPTATLAAMLLIQLRPQAIAPRKQADAIAQAVHEQYGSAGWINPAPLLAGDLIDIPAQVPIEGATGTGPITVTALGEVLYEGPLHRPRGWVDVARATGAILLLVGASPSLDDLRIPADPFDTATGEQLRRDVQRLAARGKLLAARGIIPTVNPLIRARPPL